MAHAFYYKQSKKSPLFLTNFKDTFWFFIISILIIRPYYLILERLF